MKPMMKETLMQELEQKAAEEAQAVQRGLSVEGVYSAALRLIREQEAALGVAVQALEDIYGGDGPDVNEEMATAREALETIRSPRHANSS